MKKITKTTDPKKVFHNLYKWYLESLMTSKLRADFIANPELHDETLNNLKSVLLNTSPARFISINRLKLFKNRFSEVIDELSINDFLPLIEFNKGNINSLTDEIHKYTQLYDITLPPIFTAFYETMANRAVNRESLSTFDEIGDFHSGDLDLYIKTENHPDFLKYYSDHTIFPSNPIYTESGLTYRSFYDYSSRFNMDTTTLKRTKIFQYIMSVFYFENPLKEFRIISGLDFQGFLNRLYLWHDKELYKDIPLKKDGNIIDMLYDPRITEVYSKNSKVFQRAYSLTPEIILKRERSLFKFGEKQNEFLRNIREDVRVRNIRKAHIYTQEAFAAKVALKEHYKYSVTDDLNIESKIINLYQELYQFKSNKKETFSSSGIDNNPEIIAGLKPQGTLKLGHKFLKIN